MGDGGGGGGGEGGEGGRERAEREGQRRDAEALVGEEAGFERAGGGGGGEGGGARGGALGLRPAGAWAGDPHALDPRHLPSLPPGAAQRLSSVAAARAACWAAAAGEAADDAPAGAHEGSGVRVTGKGASVRVERARPPARPGAHAGALRAAATGAWLPCLVQAQPPRGTSLEAILFEPASGAPLSGEELARAARGPQVRLVLCAFLGPPAKLAETGPWLRDRLHALADAAAERALEDGAPSRPQARL